MYKLGTQKKCTLYPLNKITDQRCNQFFVLLPNVNLTYNFLLIKFTNAALYKIIKHTDLLFL